ncbi:MAG: polyamine ABC transporter substrate-binding protein [Steroidobacteraceae bacterium]
MRSGFRNGFVTTALVLLTACGGGKQQASNVAAVAEEKVLNVYNWADYIGASTIQDFEKRTGIKVSYDTYDSYDVLGTKLMTGHSGYDVVVPSGAMANRLIRAGALLKLDRSRLKNLKNMDPEIMRIVTVNDPGNEYGLPYLFGTTGIGYNPDLVEKVLGTRKIDSLSAVFDPAIAAKLAKCGITMLDSTGDMFSIALIYLGRNPYGETPEDLTAAEAALTRARPYVRYYHSSKYVDDLATGEVCVSIGWSGGVEQARARGVAAAKPVHVDYVIPKEGAPLWIDLIAIPADAPHPQNAHAFLDYFMEPEVAAGISNLVGQANGNAASRPFVAETLRNDPTIYPTPEVYKKLYLDKTLSPETVRAINRAWTRIRTSVH